MASGKERLRLERMFNDMQARMDRQKKALDRMTLAHLEASAALMEIMDRDEVMPDGQTTPLEYAQERARQALDRMAMVLTPAAAVLDSEGESTPPVNPPNEGETDDGND